MRCWGIASQVPESGKEFSIIQAWLSSLCEWQPSQPWHKDCLCHQSYRVFKGLNWLLVSIMQPTRWCQKEFDTLLLVLVAGKHLLLHQKLFSDIFLQCSPITGFHDFYEAIGSHTLQESETIPALLEARLHSISTLVIQDDALVFPHCNIVNLYVLCLKVTIEAHLCPVKLCNKDGPSSYCSPCILAFCPWSRTRRQT